MIAIVVSRADEASEHVGKHLLELREWDRRDDGSRPSAEGGGEYGVAGAFELRTFDELHLHLEGVAGAFSADPDLLVFPSRHSGETGPLLTAHFTGNVGPAEYGGEDGRLAEAAPGALSAVVESFEEFAPEGYGVGIECTHHGPSEVGCPSLFAEVGSAREEWRDPDAARAVALAILRLEDVDPLGERRVVGIGGGHYAPRFTRVLRETPWDVGHVASDWALEDLDELASGPDAGDDADASADEDVGGDAIRAVVRQLFEQSGADRAVFDGDHPEVAAVVEDLGYEAVSETWLRAVGDRPLDLVAAVKRRLAPVSEGVRFGDRRDPGDLAVLELPTDLVSEAEGVDLDAVLPAIGRHVVAVRTREAGNRVGDAVAVPADGEADAHDAVVEELAAILRRKYDEVRREDGAVVAEERAFDPDLAREAGVPEGPAFGKLSAGEAVTVDGERIDPADVHRERTRRFSTRGAPSSTGGSSASNPDSNR